MKPTLSHGANRLEGLAPAICAAVDAFGFDNCPIIPSVYDYGGEDAKTIFVVMLTGNSRTDKWNLLEASKRLGQARLDKIRKARENRPPHRFGAMLHYLQNWGATIEYCADFNGKGQAAKVTERGTPLWLTKEEAEALPK